MKKRMKHRVGESERMRECEGRCVVSGPKKQDAIMTLKAFKAIMKHADHHDSIVLDVDFAKRLLLAIERLEQKAEQR